MTVPYVNTGSTKTAHRIGVRVVSGILWIDKLFTLSSTTPEGTIIGSVDCTTSGGNDAQITTGPINSNCDSGMVVRVTVPAGETRTVSVSKSGQAGYIGGNQSGITADVMVGSDITNQVISTTTTYGLVLDAESGNGAAASSITLTVSGGNSVQLNRTHQSNPNFC